MQALLHSCRSVVLLTTLLSTAFLSACVAVPVSGQAVRGSVVVDVAPTYYYRPAPSGYYYRPHYYYHPRRW
jgi:hypothetical protein